MPGLRPSRSAPTPGSGPVTPLQQERSGIAESPTIQHVFSAQHLDDVSHYHGGDHEDNETEYSNELEHVRNEDYDEAARKGEDELPEVEMGGLDARDLEGNLEKNQTTRSIKDPNLV